MHFESLDLLSFLFPKKQSPSQRLKCRQVSLGNGLREQECLWQAVGVFPALSFSLWVPSPLSLGFPGGTSGKEYPDNARVVGDVGLIPGSERSPEGR